MNYKVKDDLLLIREFFQITQDDFSKKINVERKTISRTENEQSNPSEEVINRIYNFIFDNGLKLNMQKEMYYLENLKSIHLLLTHASKFGINGEISLTNSRVNNDFGKGFYCGEKYENSVSFISKYTTGSVYFLDFNPDNLNSLTFEVNTEWMLAIAYYRGKIDKYKNSKIIKSIIERINNADYIIAPIADNRMFRIIDTFIDGEITDEQCKHCLAATNLGLQYVFRNQKSINQITVLEKCYVSSNEKEYYQNEQIKFQSMGNDKSKLARIQYRVKGKYIEEILV